MNPQYTRRLKKIEEILRRWLPEVPGSDWLSDAAGPVSRGVPEETLRFIIEPGFDLLGRGGKRWRPMLALLIAELHGGGTLTAELAPLLEFAHTGSLIIDDIEDSADMRRGRETAHILFGTDTAINSGNLLYFLAPRVIDTAGFPERIQIGLYRYFLENMRRLHFGQGMDIRWHRNPDLFPPISQYEQMCRFKTGSLSRLAGQTGALTAGLSPESSEFTLISDVCETLGFGFQIIDDVINLRAGNPGKARGDDIVEGKKSLPVLLHIERCPEDAEKLEILFRRAAETAGTARNETVLETIDLIESSESIEQARTMARCFLQGAEEYFTSAFKKSEPLDCLLSMIEAFKNSG